MNQGVGCREGVSHHVCLACDLAWLGDPECWGCGAWVPEVRSAIIANPSTPKPDNVPVPLIL